MFKRRLPQRIRKAVWRCASCGWLGGGQEWVRVREKVATGYVVHHLCPRCYGEEFTLEQQAGLQLFVGGGYPRCFAVDPDTLPQCRRRAVTGEAPRTQRCAAHAVQGETHG